jgi:membrane protease YdiL (CAAX protease family)
MRLCSRARVGDDASLVIGGAAMHLGILLALARFYSVERSRTGPAPAPGRAPALASGAATFLIALPLVEGTSFVWNFVLQSLGLPVDGQDMVGILENSQSVALKAALVLVATLLVPFTEELVFRGGLFRFLRTRMPRRSAIALTSLLFGSLHVGWGAHPTGLPSLMPLAVLAAVFCVAYERTGNLGTTIVAHALFNLNTFVIVAAGLGS